MTFEDKVEVRRASVGTKVLAFGFAILAVLGSFWTIVWFIRSYVEPPRMTLAPSLALAARESTPVVPPAPTVRPAPMAADPQPTGTTPAPAVAETAPAPAPAPADTPSATGSIADRWLPMTPAAAAFEPAPAPAPAATETAASPAPPESAEPAADGVAESAVPAISGPAPLPRRKPMQTAAVRARTDPPLPRPRPDGPAPQSVWTAVPTTDDRYQAGQ